MIRQQPLLMIQQQQPLLMIQQQQPLLTIQQQLLLLMKPILMIYLRIRTMMV